MARAYPLSQPRDYDHEPPQGEWQALRGELVALLDQVETQVVRTTRKDQGYQGLAERMRDLRRKVGEVEPDDRHREALRSVKRAVDRFGDRDMPAYEQPAPPPNPRETLESAIRQIRSRQRPEPAPAPPPPQARAPEPSRFDDMVRAVSGISGRLERLEVELQTQARGQSGNVKDIASQVAQLSHVVELLAGAVGETGQVKRLEGQIASLAQLVAQGQQVDLSALTQRLDDVSTTVGRLADLQVQFANRVDNPGAALRDGMASIEDGVRSIYERIEGIEKRGALPPETLDRLNDEMGQITEALRHPTHPAGLIELVEGLSELIEGLGASISRIEDRESEVGSLKSEVHELRSAVIEAMEPRFAAMELQLEALSDRLAERPPELSLDQLEAQVRQLVARMDQTGEQLSGLARMQQPEPLPDFDALADLVAARTSEAIGQGVQPPAPALAPTLSEAGLAEIEERVSRAFSSATRDTGASERSAEEFSGVRDSIEEVNQRLARLEASLSQRSREAEAAVPAPPPPPAASSPETAALAGDAAAAMPHADAMPANPAAEAPLVDKPFADIGPVRAALAAKNGPRVRYPGSGDTAAPAAPPAIPAGAGPALDPASIVRPPRPESAFDRVARESFDMDSEPAPPPPAPEAPAAGPASTNTFIAAARRAAQRQGGKPEIASDSLIARAFNSFQAGRARSEAAPAKPARQPAADRPAPTPQSEDALVADAAIDPSIDAIGDESAQPALSNEKPPGFLRRHRRAILLGLSVIALSLLTLNLVSQRLAASRATPPPAETSGDTDAAAPAEPVEDLSALPGTARVIPMVDSLATASIDPAAAQGFEPNAPVPTMPSAFDDADALPLPLDAAAPLAALPDAIEPEGSPVTVALPPEALGPEPLRRAAAEGDPRAQFEIAAIYTEGRAVPEDLEAAAIWYERAAAQGFAPAQYRLGNLYENGRGVEKDLEQARLWYQRAAEAGNRMSMHNLAALYAGGDMGEQAFDSAAEWFEQAALRGLKDSQFNLGMLHARGLGVPQDLAQSYKWFSIAASNGDADAARARDDVARSLDAETVGQLNAEVAAWQAEPIDLAANFAPIGTWSDSFDPGQTIASTDVVKSVQKALDVLGYDIGAPDGLAGPKTAEAIKSFERATGMSESGAINPRLLAVLGSQPV